MTTKQVAYIKASNAGSEDRFGHSVATSSNLAVVGAIGEDSGATGVGGDSGNNSASASGGVYVYRKSGTTWSFEEYLKASNTESNDNFGTSVATSGNLIVVGANGEDSGATGVNGDGNDNSLVGSGAAYIYRYDGSNWVVEAYLKASNTGAGDNFGAAVAINGDVIVVGATGEASGATGIGGDQTDNSVGDAGAAYVFRYNGSAWEQEAYLKASNTDPGDHFGSSVAVSGNIIVVGANGEASGATGVDGDGSDNASANAGAAYIYRYDGSTWSHDGYLKASNTDAGDNFGYSVSVSGNVVVVGADGESSGATGGSGNQNDNGAPNTGAAYVFRHDGSIWSQEAYLKAFNAQDSDSFGNVSVSGDLILVGARGEDSGATGVDGDGTDNLTIASGAAYTFLYDGTNWVRGAYLKASNTDSSDMFGISVALDSNTIVAGARFEDSGATGVNGDQTDNTVIRAGAAYIFQATDDVLLSWIAVVP